MIAAFIPSVFCYIIKDNLHKVKNKHPDPVNNRTGMNSVEHK